ncbi:MAG: DNA polymerase III subunit gamma/tau [Treponema sp.]|jgi:DNA polymerase-3 subunit gamma/tau|nr:DNA polymerase III subunit gamma/tau [Treponema sp.]
MADNGAAALPKFEVTATRRRPKTFDELAGQEFVVSTLKNSLENGTIAHAYLFSGPRGCGKTSAARILARSLNCEKEKGPTARPCGVCPSCVEIAAGSSLDVIEIDGASNTSVNDVRQIKDEVLFPPQNGRYKVYIIDEVHMLSNSAFNALLKTIEEPPPYIVFIFATTEIHKVPATIKSRCQQFSFRLIPIETIKGILKSVCEEMKIEAEDEALFWIARESTGSLRDALTLFDQVVSFSAGHIRDALIREKLGIVGLEALNKLAEACAEGDASACFLQVDEILSSGVAIEQFIIDMANYYRSLLLLRNGVTRESLLGYGPERFSAKALGAFDPPRLEQALELLLNCYRDIRYSVSPRFELESLVFKLAWLKSWVSPQELKAAVEAARNALGGQEGLERPLARGEFARVPPETKAAGEGNAGTGSAAGHSGGWPSLTEAFRRRIAGGNRALENGQANREKPGTEDPGEPGFSSGPEGEAGAEDEDVPVWSNLSKTFRENAVTKSGFLPKEPGPGAADNEPRPLDPKAERVCRIFGGTVVKDGQA